MILIVDEEYRRMITTTEYIEKIGYSVKLIDNVDEAYEFIKSKQSAIDAIILDLMMPWNNLFNKVETESGIITGYLFFQKIRKEFGYQIPIIIYTAINKPNLFKQLEKEKNCIVLNKPDPPSRIVLALEQFGVERSPT